MSLISYTETEQFFKRLFIILLGISIGYTSVAQKQHRVKLTGKVENLEGEAISDATVYIKKTGFMTNTDKDGFYVLMVPAGTYEVSATAAGYKTQRKHTPIKAGDPYTQSFVLAELHESIEDVEIIGKSVIQQVKEQPFNVVALDATAYHNTTLNLGDVINKAAGVRIRESGGVGSDMQVTLDGYTGRYVKVFIDGVPQEGVGASFSLNNIPINFAERIEVYKGVVPVEFGTDAIGGVINIVTKQDVRKWYAEASYSYGSFNTHRSYANFDNTWKNGFKVELSAFQNYSDNNYWIDTYVQEIVPGTSQTVTNTSNIQRVQRFNDAYHNEAIVGKIGFVNKPWADRFMIGLKYAGNYNEVQTGVRQATVFGDVYTYGNSFIPSLEYRKKNLFTKGLDVIFNANYNKNTTTNVDTSSNRYNWYGEILPVRTGAGEQIYQHARNFDDNFNTTLTVRYQLGYAHTFTFNHNFNQFNRASQSLVVSGSERYNIPDESRKNVAGLSYRYKANEKWLIDVFGKYYDQFVYGAVALDDRNSEFTDMTTNVSSFGYGIAGTYFILNELQAKASFEHAYRLPTERELFGNGLIELGNVSLRPENSYNYNASLSYNKEFENHSLFLEGGLIYRDTRDYIQPVIQGLGGNTEAMGNINYGKVETKGFNFTARYGYSRWLSIGGAFTRMDVRDMVEFAATEGFAQPNLTYGARMPNIPYQFANFDATFYWYDLFKKGNLFNITYDNLYLAEFPLYSEVLGSSSNGYLVPKQFAHNLTLNYGIKKGKYNFTLECKNLTDDALYDNFSLQKPGRAFYGKVRVMLGGNY